MKSNFKKTYGDRDSTKCCTALFPLWSLRKYDIPKKHKEET